MDKLTPEQRDKVLDVLFGEGYRHVIHILYDEARVCLNEITANTAEDEPKWLQEAGFCGTCAYFHREPRCQGGICGRVESKPQVEINHSCEEYETDIEYEDYWLQQGDE